MKQWALNTWLIKLNYNYQSISCLIATLIAFCCTYEIGYCYKWFTDAKLNACSKACKSLRARDTRDNGYVRSISYFRDTMEHYPSTCWEPPPAFSPAALWTHPVSVGKDPIGPLQPALRRETRLMAPLSSEDADGKHQWQFLLFCSYCTPVFTYSGSASFTHFLEIHKFLL